jgi:ketosteroid isomerase-like protein
MEPVGAPDPPSAISSGRPTGQSGVDDDEARIRALIERWAAAVHDGDLPTVLADHADDIVMFDVPPPHDGVRGIDAYRETWPSFFEWQRQGAVFAITELAVTAGTDDEFAQEPDRRLRLTIGLRKEAGRWIVTHEHHSFAIA